jgi:predicted PurR-regulated permease PerM
MKNDLRIIKNVLFFFLAVLVAYLLVLLQDLFIPLALALFMAMLLQPILAWFEQKRFPFWASLLTISLVSVAVIFLSGLIIYSTALEMIAERDVLTAQVVTRLEQMLGWVNNHFRQHLTTAYIQESVTRALSVNWVLQSSNSVAGAVGDFTGLMFMTLLYFVFILGGILKYEHYLSYLQEGNEDKTFFKAFEHVKDSIVAYMKVKFLMSLLIGVSYWIICWIFGIEFALFWGFIAFVLNFIPAIGSIFATIPPVLLGLITLSPEQLIGMTLLMLAAQQIVGNVIETRMMGTQLSLNAIVVLLGLLFWGYLWGMTGMILSVPLLVLTKVILTQIPDAKMLVKLMDSVPDQFEEAAPGATTPE